ncbi:MAG: hypothetical protein HFH36_14715 [Lachnospiraceae bacterium]|nr:hypothetical protein [Lachnospiraceae bacterium]
MYSIFLIPIWCVAVGHRTCGGLRTHRRKLYLTIWQTLTGWPRVIRQT